MLVILHAPLMHNSVTYPAGEPVRIPVVIATRMIMAGKATAADRTGATICAVLHPDRAFKTVDGDELRVSVDRFSGSKLVEDVGA